MMHEDKLVEDRSRGAPLLTLCDTANHVVSLMFCTEFMFSSIASENDLTNANNFFFFLISSDDHKKLNPKAPPRQSAR